MISPTFLLRNRYTATLWIVISSLFLVSCCEDVACVIFQFTGFYCPEFVREVTCDCDDNFLLSAGGTAGMIFEPNIGQSDARYSHVAKGSGHSILISSGETAFEIPTAKYRPGKRVRAMLEGARHDVQGQALDRLPGRSNYFLGNDQSKWRTDVPTSGKVKFAGVYPGIDVVYYGSGGQLEHDFVINPGADPSAIRIRFDGADNSKIEDTGGLAIAANGQIIRWSKPVLYQKDKNGHQKRIEGRFDKKADGSIGFETGVYDISAPLVIDPVVSFATFVGRAGSEYAARIAVDASGNTYMVGGTSDVQFPVTPGAPAGKLASASMGDVTITKMSADGKTLVYTTHLGGADTDLGFGIAVDTAGNIYITGGTNSSDYPTTPGAYQTSQPTPANRNFNADCFVTKLNAAGNAIVYSTYLGGSSVDGCSGIGVDGAGNAYVTGGTTSRDFPQVNNFQTLFRGSNDAFIAKLSPDGSRLLYSTYVGGNKSEMAFGIAVDRAGNAYIAGATTSADFPVTPGAYQTKYGGGAGQTSRSFILGDAFVMKFDPAGNPVYATYLGGNGDDVGIGIAIDSAGAAYIVGSTLSTNFPLAKAFQDTFKGKGGDANYLSGDAFITKLDPQGASIVYSSYLGGSLDDRAMAVAVDAAGNAHVTGNTLSTDFPVTADAMQPAYGGELLQNLFHTGDAFYAQIDAAGRLVYNTYVGGKATDWSAGVAVDPNGGVVMGGSTDSTNLRTTAGVAQATFGGADIRFGPAGDAFLIRFGAGTSGEPVSISGYGNSASYAGGAVAPGELITITGTNIGPGVLANAVFDSGIGKYNSLVAGTRFLFDGVAAPVYYVSAAQSAVVVPYEVAGKSTTQLVAETNGVRSAPVTIPVVASIPGLFSLDSSGRGQGVVFNEDGKLNSSTNPAAKGSIIVFFGTGEGQTTPAGITGGIAHAPYPRAVLPFSVTIGGVQTDAPAYAASVPEQLMGEFQVNVRVPLGSPSGSVPIVVTVGSASSLSAFTAFIR